MNNSNVGIVINFIVILVIDKFSKTKKKKKLDIAL